MSQSRRVWLLLGDDFNLIAHLQLVGKRHDAAANFRPDAAVPHVAVDVVGEVQRRGARRQVHHVALRRKDVDPVVEHLAAHFVEHLAGVGHLLLPGNQLAQPRDAVFVPAPAARRGALFILPAVSYTHLTLPTT